MNILVFNGSPRGNSSSTLHTCLYLEKRYPDNGFRFCNVAKDIVKLENDMSEIVRLVDWANLIIFCYPVYTFLAPSQMHRFVSALKKSGASTKDKFVTQITTSKHVFDITAHKYIEENCMDMGMKVIKGLSADMDDLTTERGRAEADSFFEYALWCVHNNVYEKKEIYVPIPMPEYEPSLPRCVKKEGFDTVIVADIRSEDKNLINMINEFMNAYPYPTRVVNIRDFPFKGGCISCFKCTAKGECFYKDGFDTFLRDMIQKADAIVLAFSVEDHSMGPRFKMYDDRQFCNGHRTVTEGKPFGYIINGDISHEDNLKLVIDARADSGGNFLSGLATDAETMKTMIARLTYALDNKYVPPRTFLGVGTMKIFRDLVYTMRGLIKVDHKYYKKHKLYDFPQKKKKTTFMSYLAGMIMSDPKAQKRMGGKFDEALCADYKKVIAETKPKYQPKNPIDYMP